MDEELVEENYVAPTEGRAICAAPSSSCGTPAGWRAGGRCLRCRHAHNEADQERRNPPLSADERCRVLAALRAGRTTDEAAAEVGRTGRALHYHARKDSELAAALAGEPLPAQRRARLGDYLAAAVRLGGDVDAVAAQLNATPEEVRLWQAMPAAIDPERLGKLGEQADQERLIELWEGPMTVPEIAEELGIHQGVLSRWVRALSLPPRAKRGQQYWQDGDLDPEIKGEFIELWGEGVPAAEIGRRYGVSGQAVAKWAHGLGLPARTRIGIQQGLTPRVEEEFRELWADESRTTEEIADVLGISRRTVSLWRRRLDLPERRARHWQGGEMAPEAEAQLRALWEAGESASDIAQQMGVAEQTVWAWSRRLKLPERLPWRRLAVLTPEVEAKFRDLWGNPTVPTTDIANQLGVHKQTIFQWRRKLGLPNRPHDPRRLAQARAAYRAQQADAEE